MTSDKQEESKGTMVQTVRIIPRVAKKLRYQTYTTGETASALIREALLNYIENGTDMPPRERRQKRVPLWMSPVDWTRASRRATREGHTMADVVEYELEKLLDNR